MPTYSYRCTDCDNRFDVVQSFSDDALTACDQCSGRLRKLFSPVGVVFKGSGFYQNDSRAARKTSTTGSAKPGASAGSAEKASSDGNGSGGTSGTEKKTSTTADSSAAKASSSSVSS